MATNTTSTYPNKVRDVANRAVELAFAPNNVFGQFAAQKQHQNGVDAIAGDKVDFYITDLLNPNTDTLSETTDPASQSMTDSIVQVELLEKGNLITTTSKLDMTTFNNHMLEVSTLVGQNAGESTDLYFRSALDAQTDARYVTYGGTGNTAKSGIDGGDDMTGALVRSSVTTLRSRNARPFEGTDYVLVVHPDVENDLYADTASTGFALAGRYAVPGDLFNMEVGKYSSARIVSTTSAKVEHYAGTVNQADTTVDGAVAAGATTFDVASATGIVAGDVVSIETAGGDWYSFLVDSIASTTITITGAFNKNGNRFTSVGMPEALAGGETVREAEAVYTSYLIGAQALAWAWALKPEIRTIQRQTGMGRLTDVSWYALHGAKAFRDASLHKIYTSASTNTVS